MSPTTTTKHLKRYTRAFGLVEVVVASGILAGVLAILYSSAILSLKTADRASRRIQAELLVTREVELLRAFRDQGVSKGKGVGDIANAAPQQYCTTLSDDGVPDTFVLNPSDKCVADSPTGMDGMLFTTSFQRFDAYRDAGNALIKTANGDPLDYANYFEVTSTWDNGRTETVALFLTDFLKTDD